MIALLIISFNGMWKISVYNIDPDFNNLLINHFLLSCALACENSIAFNKLISSDIVACKFIKFSETLVAIFG